MKFFDKSVIFFYKNRVRVLVVAMCASFASYVFTSDALTVALQGLAFTLVCLVLLLSVIGSEVVEKCLKFILLNRADINTLKERISKLESKDQ